MNGIPAHLTTPAEPFLPARSSSRCNHLFSILVLLFFMLTAAAPTSAACPAFCSYGDCSNANCPYRARPGPPEPFSTLGLDYPEWAKDFTLIARDSSSVLSYHLFYIIINDEIADSSGINLGHARSSDLNSWDILPSALHIRLGKWDNAQVWAPSIVARGDTFFMLGLPGIVWVDS